MAWRDAIIHAMLRLLKNRAIFYLKLQWKSNSIKVFNPKVSFARAILNWIYSFSIYKPSFFIFRTFLKYWLRIVYYLDYFLIVLSIVDVLNISYVLGFFSSNCFEMFALYIFKWNLSGSATHFWSLLFNIKYRSTGKKLWK